MNIERNAGSSSSSEIPALATLEISDSRIDIRARYFRECEAMLSYYLSRGISISDENADEIGELAGFLAAGIDKRDDIPMAVLNRLHRLLSQAIAPALPRTIELMHWDARKNPLLHRWLAPVPTIRSLICITVFFLAAVILALYFGDDPNLYRVSVLSLTGTKFVHVMAFYMGLAGLGSAFSVLYDARTYIVEGTYDPRIGSNYGIRIMLGIVSGMILTQLVAQPEISAATTESSQAGAAASLPYGMPVLALLGGFAAQFVYKGLNRMVDALSSIFEPSRRQELEAKARDVRLEAQQSDMASTADRIAAAVNVFSAVQKNPASATSPEVLGQLLQVAGSTTAGKKATSAISTVLGPAQGLLDKVEGAVQAGKVLAAVVPDGEFKSILNKVGKLEATVSGIKSLAGTGSPFGAAEMLVEAAGSLPEKSAVHGLLSRTVSAFSKVPGVASLAGGPSGLAIAVVLGTARLGGAAYDLWKVRVLDAEFNQNLIPPLPSLPAIARTIFDALPDLAQMLGPGVTDNPAARGDFARRALAAEDDALFAEHGAASGQDFASFAAQLRSFRQLVAGEELAGQLPVEVLEEVGAEDPRALFDAVDEIRGNPQAFAALDQLFLMASKARDDDVALEGMISALGDMKKEGNPK
ncbi:hypothetical protein [Mangrovicoccus sp. HB161399]|uniref:hypothetical protein n=1 Tax=Mangrovicoccus sp. HB161399 TaxID=2720392 RepID=UPI001554D002|nr:hypothetical protein [Mangrovicoccus sp. HB161399]